MINIPFFPTLFSTPQKKPKLPDSQLVKNIKQFAQEKNYPLFEDVTIYHRSESITLPLALFIPNGGLVIFSVHNWNVNELKNVKATTTHSVTPSQNSIAFEKRNEFIKEKFFDLTNTESLVLYNFIVFDNISKDEYKQIDTSLQSLLQEEKIFFSDFTVKEIEEKLHIQTQNKLSIDATLPYIFSQYLIINDTQVAFANPLQREFIDSTLEQTYYLQGERFSGKTNCIVQKALLEQLQNPKRKIVIVAPSKYHQERLHQLFLQIIEASSIVIDMTKIEILLPSEILQLHSSKYKQEKSSGDTQQIDHFLMQKEFFLADILFCDDTFALPSQFVTYLKQLQKKHTIVFVNSTDEETSLHFTQSYAKSEAVFLQGGEYQLLLQTLYELHTKDPKATFALYIQSNKKEAIAQDIEGFCGIEAMPLTTEKTPKTPLVILSYNFKAPLQCDYTLFTDICTQESQTLTMLRDSSKKRSFIIYKEECDTITTLKKEQKDNDESH
jgi:Fe-S cluster biosynthesis and repair protein YggX